ncbi:hypothetical protein [Micromonospora sp. NBC_01796]|uniref:hypothetical protein n=1 Tax=Micromonospora sp. NBC_01796 TaxID=2975987 RepID=UPI002DD984D7|nr:hypothetical protein [Micromonospora sp. NBC_01796]WSA84483.1 hypothetical protein OIE47_29620 [Micromonospora sp. NBC_01796]
MTAEPGDGMSRLTKMTCNLTPAALDARDALTSGWRVTQTDAVNRALRIAAVLHTIAPEDQLRVVRSDGSIVDIYLV